MKLYQTIQTTLPPTPSKFHYIFNMRDLSRVYEGLCQATLDKFDTPGTNFYFCYGTCFFFEHVLEVSFSVIYIPLALYVSIAPP
jgi:hypothetical protein